MRIYGKGAAFGEAPMRFVLVFPLLIIVLLTAAAQNLPQGSQSVDSESTQALLEDLNKRANEAHTRADIGQEVGYRQRFSQEAWANFALHPKSPGRFNCWAIVFFNDLQLGLLLEGTQKWPEAEAIFRHNRAMLAHERLAGDDIKSENQLHLAHLLAREGKQTEAQRICSHWERRVKHIADGYLFAVKHDVPTPPLYDSPEVETGAWDLACGRPEDGLSLIGGQIAAHPGMLAPFTVLENYYLAEGGFQEAFKAEKGGTSAMFSH